MAQKKTHAHICSFFFFFLGEMAHAHIWWNFINIKKKKSIMQDNMHFGGTSKLKFNRKGATYELK